MVLSASARTVELPRREVLGDEHDLSHIRTEGLDLVEDGGLRPGTLHAPKRGDRAVGALPVATLCDLHVGPGALGCRPGKLEEIERRDPPRRRRADRYRCALDGRRASQASRGSQAGRGTQVGRGRRDSPNLATRSISGIDAVSSSPYRSARHPVTTSLAPSRRVRDISKMVSIDSCLAASMNAQVLTTTRSAPSGLRSRGKTCPEESPLELCGVDLVLRAAQSLEPIPGGHCANLLAGL